MARLHHNIAVNQWYVKNCLIDFSLLPDFPVVTVVLNKRKHGKHIVFLQYLDYNHHWPLNVVDVNWQVQKLAACGLLVC